MQKKKNLKILEIDPYLMPFKDDLDLRMSLYNSKRKEILKGKRSITDFANGYKYFGFHKVKNGWAYREWAPAAERMYLTGDFNSWNTTSHELTRLDNGVFEIELKGEDALKVGQKVQAIIINNGNELRRIPTYATRVVQDPVTYLWCAEIEDTFADFDWTDQNFKPEKTPFMKSTAFGTKVRGVTLFVPRA